MIAVDTSVVVAAFASWHERHGPARDVISSRPRLPWPAALEAYAVLTRLRPPHRAPATVVRDFLEAAFDVPYMTIATARLGEVIPDLVARGVSGGASYDAVIALTAREAGATLVTCDRRARLTYERLGVPTEFLG